MLTFQGESCIGSLFLLFSNLFPLCAFQGHFPFIFEQAPFCKEPAGFLLLPFSFPFNLSFSFSVNFSFSLHFLLPLLSHFPQLSLVESIFFFIVFLNGFASLVTPDFDLAFLRLLWKAGGGQVLLELGEDGGSVLGLGCVIEELEGNIVGFLGLVEEGGLLVLEEGRLIVVGEAGVLLLPEVHG